jgi:gamma-glutamyltranspeptidase/glutathione hydrolase
MQLGPRRLPLAVLAGICLAVLVAVMVNPWAATPAPPSGAQPVPGDGEYANGVVVSVSAAGSEAGLSALKKGGNAVDAAVCTAFALVASYPPAGNLGGGGFMLVHPAPGAGEPVVFDYRETAPAAVTRTMFNKGDTQYGHKVIATPGTVRGLALAHRRFGKLPWAELLTPAIALARDGFPIDANLASSLNEYLASTRLMTKVGDLSEFLRVYGKPGGGRWKAGDLLVQADLARTLQALADEGPDAFYTGSISRHLLAEMERGKGRLTAKDLARYRATERKPLTARYRGRYDVYAPPPPSAGGTCLVEMLNILDNFDLKGWGRYSPRTIHVMVEAMRRVGYDRARYLGDPAFVTIPPHLTTRAYGAQLANTIDLTKATPSEALGTDIPLAPEGESTTHFSVIDKSGMAVSNTYTLERKWGSRVVVRGAGFLLNNNMYSFNLFPAVTDRKGQIGTEPNTIAPGKKMISSQTPTIVAENGRVRLVTGTPGSRSIPNTVLCMLVNVLDFEMPLRQAMDAPRFTHQWFPDEINYENLPRSPEMMNELSRMGHTVTYLWHGDAHTIWVNPRTGRYVGVADWRISGAASGY